MTRSFCNDEVVARQSDDSDLDNGPAACENRILVDKIVPKAGRFALMCGKLRTIEDIFDYKRAKAHLGDTVEEFDRLFRRFLAGSVGRRCLRLLFNPETEIELGPNWATLNLAPIEVLAKEGGPVSIDLEDEYFDTVLLTGLGQISRPQLLIAEVRRVLRRAGQIWVQVPLCAPYCAPKEEAPREYWRITPPGLRVLMEGFDEILCSVYLPCGSPFREYSFFYGLKPPIEAGDSPE